MWAYSLKTQNTFYSFHDVTYFQSYFLIFCTLFWITFPVHNLYCCWFNGVGSHWRGIFMVFKTYSTSWAPYSCPRTAPSRDAKCLMFKFCLQTFMPPGQLLTDPVLSCSKLMSLQNLTKSIQQSEWACQNCFDQSCF